MRVGKAGCKKKAGGIATRHKPQATRKKAEGGRRKQKKESGRNVAQGQATIGRWGSAGGPLQLLLFVSVVNWRAKSCKSFESMELCARTPIPFSTNLYRFVGFCRFLWAS
jgi:hypothetical protein